MDGFDVLKDPIVLNEELIMSEEAPGPPLE